MYHESWMTSDKTYIFASGNIYPLSDSAFDVDIVSLNFVLVVSNSLIAKQGESNFKHLIFFKINI